MPPTRLVCVVILLMLVPTFSFKICADSQVSGCCFSVIWGADVVSSGAQDVLFGMLAASTMAPWGIMKRSSGTWEHEKGDLGLQA